MELEATAFAQDRNNRGNNTVYLNGSQVPSSDTDRGIKALNMLSSVTKNAKINHVNDKLSYYKNDRELVLQVDAEESDTAGRTSGFALHVRFPEGSEKWEAFPNQLVEAVHEFAKIAELTIHPKIDQGLLEVAKLAQKKNDKASRPCDSNRGFVSFVDRAISLVNLAAERVANLKNKTSSRNIRSEGTYERTPGTASEEQGVNDGTRDAEEAEFQERRADQSGDR